METSANNKCKAFTSLEQPKRLAEILPLESADMRYHTVSHYNQYPCDEIIYTVDFDRASGKVISAWSLSALLSVLSDYTLQTNSDGTVFLVCDSKKPMISDAYNNPVDACVDMVEKLKELNLL